MKSTGLILILALGALAGCPPRAAEAQLGGGTGNLSVELIDGTLFIVGDRETNAIIVSQAADPLTGVELLLVGGDGRPESFFPWIPLEWRTDTTVNGGGPLLFDAADVTEVVLVAGGGDDSILLKGKIDADVFIDTGAGTDRVLTYSLDANVINGDLYINTGNDADFISFVSTGPVPTTIVGTTEISTGHGKDFVFLGDARFGGNVSINTGVHDDSLRSGGARVYGNLLVETGHGDDHISSFRTLVPLQIAIGGFAVFDGGQGLDSFDPSEIEDLDGNGFDPSKLFRLNFEVPDI